MSFELIKRQIIKRGRLANILWPLRSNGLYCFNFHRIGDASNTPFDPCVYSCDQENFKQYILFLREHFRIIDMKELDQIITQGKKVREKLALITFDDGYYDNYEIAYPILKAYKVPATFFVTTSLISSNIIPWWDEIAWHVKCLAGKSVKLSIWPEAITLPDKVDADIIRRILGKVKSFPAQINSQLSELQALTQQEVPSALSQQLFMQWCHLTELENNSITIGAHSHTHRILSSLSPKDLTYELTESKRLLEQHLSHPIESLSYPVGGESTYQKTMFTLLSKLGYHMGFTFRPYVNRRIQKNRYELGRLSIDRPFNEQFLKEMILTSPKH